MRRHHTLLACLLLAVAPAGAVHASQDTPKSAEGAGNLAGLHDFDFLVGDWKVRHRKLKARLVGSRDWTEFDGTLSMRKLMDGRANVGDNLFNTPDGPYRGIGFRAYDPKTGQWASWWLDGRNPFGALDPAIKGGFKDGIGTFEAVDTLQGKPIRMRVTWSRITAETARWEQAFSADGGKTWEVNWVSDFQRVR
ncbi:DUF1579 domain-containing protein [Luteimonas aquatica]|uniref:DUF1579 domain-containing protein n=1 Tax=Luteimonas aquatica TaxID=450364 RepID=UPI001F57DD91|nr:DUF1579 domain-containing protein [Luteimonas aquatica]